MAAYFALRKDDDNTSHVNVSTKFDEVKIGTLPVQLASGWPGDAVSATSYENAPIAGG